MSNEKLNNTFQNKITILIKKNLRNLSIFFVVLILILFGYFFFLDFKKKSDIKISEEYTQATIQFKEKKIEEAKRLLENIINKKHKFYSPLSLYFIIDNNLEKDTLITANFFDKILAINSIDKENLNLIKIKKAIFLFNTGEEESILRTLNPVINSDSIWREMAIKLISDYFLSKNQIIKANEYIKLLNNKIAK